MRLYNAYPVFSLLLVTFDKNGCSCPIHINNQKKENEQTVTPFALPKGKPESVVSVAEWNNELFLALFLSLNPFTPPRFLCRHYQVLSKKGSQWDY